MITRRQKQFDFVKSFALTHREELTRALELLVSYESFSGAVFENLLNRLEQAFGKLLEAEHRHLDETGKDGLHRMRRDAAVSKLRQTLFDLRYVFRGLQGFDAAEAQGFERRIAADPLPLLRQGQRVLGRLRKPAPPPEDRKESVLAAHVELIRSAAKGVLEPAVCELREALEELGRERGKAQGTRSAKNGAMKSFDKTYRLVVGMLISAFRLAGKAELATRISISPLGKNAHKTLLKEHGSAEKDEAKT